MLEVYNIILSFATGFSIVFMLKRWVNKIQRNRTQKRDLMVFNKLFGGIEEKSQATEEPWQKNKRELINFMEETGRCFKTPVFPVSDFGNFSSNFSIGSLAIRYYTIYVGNKEFILNAALLSFSITIREENSAKVVEMQLKDMTEDILTQLIQYMRKEIESYNKIGRINETIIKTENISRFKEIISEGNNNEIIGEKNV